MFLKKDHFFLFKKINYKIIIKKNPMDVSWKNVDVFVPNEGKRVPGKYAHLIKDCSGKARKGKLMAVMGPSGSGKTTMLKALVGRIPPGSKTNGVIQGDGKERDINEWITKTGYVDQDDNIFESLTVYDTIMYAAKFRAVDQDHLEEKVQTILKDLKIENIAYNKMNSISGGERKRTMIAVELVSDPDLIFLDEPTSGLDTYITISFVKLLKEYATKSGKTIIITIHQPPQEAFRCFDDLLLLAEGKTVYCGEANKCEDFLKGYGLIRNETSPFPDFVLEVLVREDIESNAIQDIIKQNSLKYDNDQPLAYKQKTKNDMSFDFSFNLRHILLLTRRKLSVYDLTFGKIVSYILKSMIIALVACGLYFFDKHIRSKPCDPMLIELFYMMYITLSLLFFTISCSASIFSILPEYKVVKREIGVRSYSMLSYFFSIYLSEFIEQLPFVLIYIITTYILLRNSISYLTVFILFGTFLITLPSFILLGSLTKNSKLLYFFMIIPMFFMYMFICGNMSGYSDLANPVMKTVIQVFSGINGVWPLSVFFQLVYYIIAKFFTLPNISKEQNIKIQKSMLDAVYRSMPPFPMHIWAYIGYSILISVLYALLSIFLIGVMLRPSIRMKLSAKK
ncbi:ABC transporter [Spraguea lophii 42_110]|uniref:ABC transporter n=1 Tax=Spraguea lophii (strain 42_110) TaxID=1358809 RepID=S7W8L8_SPRLO|nr:ABC transporter [Spraguea lophii 42_110]